jgi:hypothetical protein
MPSRMYSTIQLLEIMRRSAFTSPLSYPFLLGFTVARWTDLLPDIVNSRNGQGNFCLKGVFKGSLKKK